MLVLALSGCADSAGPLVLQAGDKSCADSTKNTDLVFGLYIKDAGPHPIEITSLTFGTSTHVRVTGAWVVPNYAEGPNSVGVGTSTYPLTTPSWAKREAIPGAVVPGNTESSIAVHLALSSGATAGYATDTTVKYTDADRQQYVATSDTVIGFGPNAKCG